MAPSLGSLPPELLNQVIVHINKSDHLLNLALCCRAFHNIVLPHLFSHITLRIREAPEGGHHHPGLWGLIDRLMNNSLLASSVRSITFPDAWEYNELYALNESGSFVNGNEDNAFQFVGGCKQGPIPEQIRPTNRAILEAAPAALSAEEMRHTVTVKAYAEHEWTYLQTAMLLLAVPNLEILDIVSPCLDPDRVLRLFERASHQLPCVDLLPRTSHAVDHSMISLQQALYKSGGASLTARPFQHLKVLAWTLNEDQPEMLSFAFPVFLCLPAIREILLLSVNCDKASNDQRAWTSTYPAYGPSTAERLELRNCPLGEHDIKLALHACTSLRTFLYDFELYIFNIYEPYQYLNIIELIQALSTSKETLENLWIDGSPEEFDQSFGDDSNFCIPSLKKFHRLKNLMLGMFLLFGRSTIDDDDGSSHLDDPFEDSELPVLADILPQSVESIYISRSTGRLTMLAKALENLLMVKAACVPRLRTITFEAFLTGNVPSFSKLYELAAAVEVEIHPIDESAVKFGENETPLNLGQGWDGSVTWASPYDSDWWIPRLAVKGKRN